MSDNSKVEVEFAGGVAPSYDSSVEHVRKGLRETAAEYAKATGEFVVHFAKASAEHAALEKVLHKGIELYKEHKTAATAAAEATGEVGASNGILSASFSVLRVTAARALGGVAPAVAGFLSGFGLVYGAVKVVNGALYLLEKASGTAMIGLSKFSVLEDLAGKLRRVSGSAELARQKVGELAATFRGTTVSVPAAVDAYRSARVADNGSGELSSAKGLRMLGDVGASSGNGIEETTSAVSKLYSELQSGQPIKDSADQLRSMGIISGETRAMLDRLLASGKSGPEVWAALKTSLEASSGAMKEQQQTLSGLQKAVQDAKDQLYTAFAKGSVDFEKDKLGAKAAILQKLTPVAEESGDIYGGLKSSLSGLVKKLLEVTGAKAAQDKALESGGGLKIFTDVVIVAAVALGAFIVLAAAAAVAFAVIGTFTIGIGAALAGAVAFGLAVAAIPALVLAAGAAVGIYVLHLKKVVDAQAAFVDAGQKIINSLEEQRRAIVTTADKAKYLADAYAALKKAKEDLANAKTPEDRRYAQSVVNGIEAEVHAGEHIDDSTLKPGEAEAKVDAELKERADGQLSGQEKVDRAYQAAVNAHADAYKKREKLIKLEAKNTPEGRAQITDDTYKAGLEQLVVNARTESKAADLTEAKSWDTYDAARKKVADDEEAKKKTDKEAAEKAQKEKDDAAKAERTKTVGLAEADAESKIAAISSEGIQRAREEYEINRQLLEVKLQQAEAEGDAVKLAKLKADYYRDAQAQAKREEDARKNTQESERSLAEAKANRQDAADRRQLEQDEKSGKITDQQRREGEAAILERQRQRINEDAARKEKEAAEAKQKGDPEKAARLQREAVDLRGRADALTGQEYDLLHPEQQRRAPVANELRRIGGGGAAYYGSGRNGMEAKADETNRLLKEANGLLKEANRRDNRQKVL